MKKVITLTLESEGIKYLSKKDKQLGKVFNLIGDLSYRPYEDHYSFLVETIIGQMLSNKVANVISNRVTNACGGLITPESISNIGTEGLRSLGLSNAKVSYIFNLTDHVYKEQTIFTGLLYKSDQEVIKYLTNLKGIGNWTAKMYLIFALDRKDVLPYEDGAFIQSYSWLYNTDKTLKNDVEQICKNWRPYSSIAARYLYKLLDNGYTKYKNIDEALSSTNLI